MADDIATEAARRKIAATMIDALVDRLPGHTRTQCLALLRTAFHETRHHAMANLTPFDIERLLGRAGGLGLAEVSDVLFDGMAAILAA
jgi:hypothetical protein